MRQETRGGRSWEAARKGKEPKRHQRQSLRKTTAKLSARWEGMATGGVLRDKNRDGKFKFPWPSGYGEAIE